MPEGDTIHRLAEVLRGVLSSERIVACETFRVRFDGEALLGRTIERVEARGKNLLLALSGDLVLRSHLGMTGSWQLREIDAPPSRPASQLRVSIETADHVAACFNAPVVELLDAFALRGSRALSSLGPDLLDPACDLDEVKRRLRRADRLAIGEALLRQSLVAGIGNVYKSELLFLRRVSPFRSVASLDDACLDALLEEARRLLRANVRSGPRVTRHAHGRVPRPFERSGSRHWVYRRSGLPCFECGTRIEMRRQGDAGRSTYHCPTCQRG